VEYLQERNIHHLRGRPLHPKTQGKIKRYHRSMKNVVNLDNYFSPGQLESLKNLTAVEVYFGNGHKNIKQRKLTKNRTLEARKKQFRENHFTL